MQVQKKDNQLQSSKHVLQPPHEKYKNIVFDLGGVLIYWNSKEILNKLFGSDQNFSFDQVIDLYNSAHWGNWDRGTMTTEEVAQGVADRFDKEKVLHLMRMAPSFLTPLEAGLDIFRQVKALGYKTYVLSNLAPECHHKILTESDFLEEFDGHIFSYQVKAIKPEPEIYKALLDTYSLTAEECLFIDDLERNIVGAKNMGIEGIICKDHDFVLQELKNMKVIV
jgi:putative hydrolase of the HAD superfamily